MRHVRFAALVLGVALGLGFPAPSHAEGDTGFCVENIVVLPTDAMRALQASLPRGTTLASASEADVMSAYEKASRANPGYAGEMASLIAVGRPDLVDPLRQIVQTMCAPNADAILRKIAFALQNPTPDQLAALATNTGTSPAAGDDGDGSVQ